MNLERLMNARFTRRDGLKLTGLAAIAGVSACGVLGENNTEKDEDQSVLPRGETLGLEFVEDEENFIRLIEATQVFPVQKLTYISGEHPEIRLGSINPQVREVLLQKKILTISPQERIFVDNSRDLGIDLTFTEPVKFGSDFTKDHTPWPAFMFAFQHDFLEKNQGAFVIAPSSGFGALFNEEDYKNKQREAPINEFHVNFATSFEELDGMDLVFIFNKGLYSHMSNSAEFLPIRFRVNVQNSQDLPGKIT